MCISENLLYLLGFSVINFLSEKKSLDPNLYTLFQNGGQ